MLRRLKIKVDKIKKKQLTREEQRQHQKQVNEIKSQLNKCGNNLKVIGSVDITSPEKLSIGDECRLNDKVYINARSSVVIGDDVTISYGAKIISTGYDVKKWSETGIKQHIENKPIYIGNHCWIGAGAIILPGIHITGEYVVIAAGAVVTKSINESRVIVAGNPAKIIKEIE